MAGAYPGISRDCHATVVPGAFSKQKCRALIPTGVSDTELGAKPASHPCVRGVCRQPGCFRPGNSCCGDARAKGLKTGVAAPARCARLSRIFLITAGSSMLAITLTAPPQCSQVKMSILNTRFNRWA